MKHLPQLLVASIFLLPLGFTTMVQAQPTASAQSVSWFSSDKEKTPDNAQPSTPIEQNRAKHQQNGDSAFIKRQRNHEPSQQVTPDNDASKPLTGKTGQPESGDMD